MANREKLDEQMMLLADLDRELVRLMERRGRLISELIASRPDAARYAPITDAARIRALEDSALATFPPGGLRLVFQALDQLCRVNELAPRVATVGTEGGFAYMAACQHFGPYATITRADTPERALDEVVRSRVDFAILPYESMREGLAFSNVMGIVSNDLKLVGEEHVSHTLRLVSCTGNASDVEKIFVAPQFHALSQIFIETHFPKATVLDVRSAQAAWDLARDNHGSAAIVPAGMPIARRQHDGSPAATSQPEQELRVVQENVGDEGEIRIRYAIVSRLPVPRTGNDATAVLFGVHDKPGALHSILEAFKERNCNLRRIQSRPINSDGWEYVFYVEVSGHVTDRPLVAALEGVKSKARMVKIVGSFPLSALEAPVASEFPRS